MNTNLFLGNALGWGTIVWLFGYVLGIAFFAFVPAPLIGWVIMPFGIIFALWILLRWVKAEHLWQYVVIALAWTLIAVLLDYTLLVQVFQPADGYYKLDVYLYYALTFIFPLLVGWYKRGRM